jgi:hypothetical protein
LLQSRRPKSTRLQSESLHASPFSYRFAGHLAGQVKFASSWHVIVFNGHSMEQISELTRFGGAPIALTSSALPDSNQT